MKKSFLSSNYLLPLALISMISGVARAQGHKTPPVRMKVRVSAKATSSNGASVNQDSEEELKSSAYALAITAFGQNGAKNIVYEGAEHQFMLSALKSVRAKFPSDPLLSQAWKYATLGTVDHHESSDLKAYTRSYFAILTKDYRVGNANTEPATESDEQEVRNIVAGCGLNVHANEYDDYYFTDKPGSIISSRNEIFALDLPSDRDQTDKMRCSNPLAMTLAKFGVKKLIISKSYDVDQGVALTDKNAQSMSVSLMADSFSYTDMEYVRSEIAQTPGLEVLNGFRPAEDGIGGIPEELAMDIKLKDAPAIDLSQNQVAPFTLVYHPSNDEALTRELTILASKKSDGTYGFKIKDLGQFPKAQELLKVLTPSDSNAVGWIGDDGEGNNCRVRVHPYYQDSQGKRGSAMEYQNSAPHMNIIIPFYADTQFKTAVLYKNSMDVSFSNQMPDGVWTFYIQSGADARGTTKDFFVTVQVHGKNGKSGGIEKRCTNLKPESKDAPVNIPVQTHSANGAVG